MSAPSVGDAHGCAPPRPAVLRLVASYSRLEIAERRENRFDDLRLVRVGDLLERLGVRHRQGGARGPAGPRGGGGGSPVPGPRPGGWAHPPRRAAPLPR